MRNVTCIVLERWHGKYFLESTPVILYHLHPLDHMTLTDKLDQRLPTPTKLCVKVTSIAKTALACLIEMNL